MRAQLVNLLSVPYPSLALREVIFPREGAMTYSFSCTPSWVFSAEPQGWY